MAKAKKKKAAKKASPKAAKKKKVAAKKPAPKKKAAARKPAPKKKAAPKKQPAAKARPAKTPARTTLAGTPSAKAKGKKPTVKVSRVTVPPAGIHRRDGAGHLDPDYAAKLLELSGDKRAEEEEDHAFVGEQEPVSREPLSRELGREAVEQMTSGEYVGEDEMQEQTEDEVGGPYVITSDKEEVAHGTDESNPKGAKKEPFPKVMSDE